MALDCPRCRQVVLNEIEVGGVVLDRCPRCAGIWFDNSEIGELVGRQSQVTSFESIVPPSDLSDEKINCPRCDDVSLRKLVSQREGKRERVVYRCVSCIGTWLDRGELRDAEDAGLAEVLQDFFFKVL